MLVFQPLYYNNRMHSHVGAAIGKLNRAILAIMIRVTTQALTGLVGKATKTTWT